MEKQNNTDKRFTGYEITLVAVYSLVSKATVYNYLNGKTITGANKVAVEKAIKKVERERKNNV